jgi:sulfite exporter TauE/SafE
MSCDGLCKLACVLGTLISALAALAYAKRTWTESDSFFNQIMAGIIMIAGITTLWCSFKWVIMKPINKQTI